MIHVLDDAESLAAAAAEHIAETLVRTVDQQGLVRLALAGGSTPRRTYELLAAMPYRERIPWRYVHVYWGDERCVPPDDERSNERMAREALLNHVRVRPQNVHPIRCTGDPHVAASDYEALLQREFGATEAPLDMVVLGIGADGHTAGLFPGSPALLESLAWTAVVQREGEAFPRITLTLPVLTLAPSILVMASGAGKTSALRRALADDPDLPITRVRPSRGELIWAVDRAAMGEE